MTTTDDMMKRNDDIAQEFGLAAATKNALHHHGDEWAQKWLEKHAPVEIVEDGTPKEVAAQKQARAAEIVALKARAEQDVEWRARTEIEADREIAAHGAMSYAALTKSAAWSEKHAAKLTEIERASDQREVYKARVEPLRAAVKQARQRFDSYVAKQAATKKWTLERAYAELVETDEVYRHLLKQYREAEEALPPREYAAMREEAYRADVEQVEAAKVKAGDASMVPAEREMHKRAQALAEKRGTDLTSAMGELMETSAEFVDLYRQVPLQKQARAAGLPAPDQKPTLIAVPAETTLKSY